MVVSNIFLYFPDFIGHPLCFKEIIPITRDKCDDTIFISYHKIDAYNSIPELAKSILNYLRMDFVNKTVSLIGYSFGGLVAFEVAKILNENSISNGIYLIDSHLIETKFQSKESKVWTLDGMLKKYEQLSFILPLIELNEINYPLVEKNLILFENYLPNTTLEKAHLFSSKGNFRIDAYCSTWKKYFHTLTIKEIDTTHWDIMRHKFIKSFIKEL
jgi:thioesterase domain-containing protein